MAGEAPLSVVDQAAKIVADADAKQGLPTHAEQSSSSNLLEEPRPQAEARTSLKQHEVVSGGDVTRSIEFSPEDLAGIAGVLMRRQEDARLLQGKLGHEPSTVERFVLNLSSEKIAQIEKGGISREDMAIVLFTINDEAFQKSGALGKYIQDGKIEPGALDRIRGLLPFLPDAQTRIASQLTGENIRLTSDYVEASGKLEDLVRQLEDLNQLRINVETALYGSTNDARTSIYPLDLAEQSTNRLYGIVREQIREVLAQKNEPRDYTTLFREDPAAAQQILLEANGRALTRIAEQSAKSLLLSEKPAVSTSAIESRTAKLEEKPKPEDLSPFEDDSTKAAAEFTAVNETFGPLKTKFETAEADLNAKKQAFEQAQKVVVRLSPELRTRITALETELADLKTHLMPPAGLSAKDEANYRTNQGRSLGPAIQELSKELAERRTKLNQVLETEAIAEAARDAQQEIFDRIKTEYDPAKADFNTKKTAKENAENQLAAKRKEIERGEVPADKKEQAEALRRWREVHNGFETIVDSRFSQKHGDEFSRERLASTDERSSGQIDGAERIREQIFLLVNKAGYNPELARKMLSDETIARAIVWVYKIDTARPIDATGNTVNNLFYQLDLRRNSLTTTKETLTTTPARQTGVRKSLEDSISNIEAEIRNMEKQLVRSVLPHLHGSQFQAGDLIRFLANEGLKSAEKGNPYLELSEYFRQTKPELRLAGESIYREGLGQTRIQERDLTWEGDLPDTAFSRFFGDSLALRYRIQEHFERESAQYAIEVETNGRFLQSLPDHAHVNTPEAIRRIFYDENNNLRTEIRGRDRFELARMIRERRLISPLINIPQWVRIQEGNVVNAPGVPASEGALNALAPISPDIPRTVNSSTADYILQTTPQERLKLLKGLSIEVPAMAIPLAENPAELHTYTIDFDNAGRFFITDITNPAAPQRLELNAFFERRLGQYTRHLGVQTLNTQERNSLRGEFLQIQSVLGREILRGQQRR